MLDKIYMIRHHATALKLKAAQKHNISPEKCHIGHLILQGLLDRPNSLNQIDAATDKSETNISVARRSCRLASAMHKYGLQLGDSVVLMGYNHLDLVIPYYACHYNGYSVCAIDPSYEAVDLQALFPYINPKVVFCQKKCEEIIKEAFVVNNIKGELVFFDDKDADLEKFIRQHKGTEINFRPAEFDHSKTNAWLMLTSGTTGLPKVVVIAYDTLLNDICCWFYGLRADGRPDVKWSPPPIDNSNTTQVPVYPSEPFTVKYDIVLAMATLQWLSAAIYFIAGPLRCYTRLQSSTPMTSQNLIIYINKYKPNTTAWTPYLLKQFIEAAENGCCDLSSFKAIAVAGSSIEKQLLIRFKKICSAYLYLVYGMTELLAPVFDFNEDTPEKSTGSPNNKYKFKLVDEDGNSIEKAGKSGELWIKGDDFFKGYLNNPEETKKMISEDGWIMTGDIFKRDEQDFYYFVERKRLLIRYLGVFISPLQMEEVIKRHPSVNEACVVGIPDASCMELPIAAIQRRNGDKVDPEDIFRLLKSALPDNKQIHGGLFFVDSFPITPSGKVNRSKVRELAMTSPRIIAK